MYKLILTKDTIILKIHLVSDLTELLQSASDLFSTYCVSDSFQFSNFIRDANLGSENNVCICVCVCVYDFKVCCIYG